MSSTVYKTIENVTFTRDDTTNDIVICLPDQIDAIIASVIEREIINQIQTAKTVTFDLSNLIYTSSSGLRLLLIVQKQLHENQQKMYIKNPNNEVMELFQTTGFAKIFNIIT